ncbi:ABC transporter ATP-binding protein [Aureimonas frigidaquae]|uniref:ABC transporter n=1 Tax=Aureimonas frigidaquae TaxID=424757 RepID=A0A0P0Z3Q8_9HYPH|nr:ABC transporter ATP-binding protein [Aureimonas frigidaquae]BAT28749.1 ABC transporter [Aureimonas frigidaquae]
MGAEVPPPPEITCTDLSLRYRNGAGWLDVLTPLTATFQAGHTTAILGPSGCGKSSWLRLIAGLEDGSSGEVSIGGLSPVQAARAGRIAMAFQDPSLLPWRSVRGNVALARRLARQAPDPSGVDELIRLVGLDSFAQARPHALSGGMRQRAAIARSLATRPGLLLLDEPFAAVDEITRMRLNRELPPLWRSRGTTAILVTHSISEAVLLADRVLVLSERPARIIADMPITIGGGDADARRAAPGFGQTVSALQAILADATSRPVGAVA